MYAIPMTKQPTETEKLLVMLHYANKMVTALKIKSKEIKTWLKNLRKRSKVLVFKTRTLEKTINIPQIQNKP